MFSSVPRLALGKAQLGDRRRSMDVSRWSLEADGSPQFTVAANFFIATGAEGGVVLIEHATTPENLDANQFEKVQIYFDANGAMQLGKALLALARLYAVQ
jgi:hypothetical protein